MTGSACESLYLLRKSCLMRTSGSGKWEAEGADFDLLIRYTELELYWTNCDEGFMDGLGWQIDWVQFVDLVEVWAWHDLYPTEYREVANAFGNLLLMELGLTASLPLHDAVEHISLRRRL